MPAGGRSADVQWLFDHPGGVNFSFRGHVEGSGTGEPEYPIVNGGFIYWADVDGTASYKTYR